MRVAGEGDYLPMLNARADITELVAQGRADAEKSKLVLNACCGNFVLASLFHTWYI